MTSSTISPQPAGGAAQPASAVGPVAPAASQAANGLASTARSHLPTRLVALTPLWVLLGFSVMWREYIAGMLVRPPEVAGLPLGLILTATALSWTLIGARLVWNARSPLGELLALLLFTIPATVVVVLAPALAVIVRVLG